MQRIEGPLLLAVSVLAAFVIFQVATSPSRGSQQSADQAATIERGDAGPSAAAASAGAPASDVSANASEPLDAALIRDVGAIHARIAATPGTYMNDMLVDLKHQIVRWPDYREQDLRVWVQAITPVHDFDVRYVQMARDAVSDWANGDMPLRFNFVLDSASADIRIVWLDRFPPQNGRQVGTTRRRNDRSGWLSTADITVAIHDSAGTVIKPDYLAGIVRHEAGHALGLGHSNDPRTKMYPVETENDIMPADRATLQLLYQLPPGVLP